MILFRRTAVAAAATLLACVLTAGEACAADSQPTPAATPTATADSVSPARLDLARKILIAVGLKASIDEIVPAMLGQLQSQMLRIHPEMGKALHETLVALLPEFNQGESGVFDDTSHTLASQLSDAELQQALTFFQSPAGLKYTQAQAAVLTELGVSGGVWREKLTKIMVDRVREEMKKKGFVF
jgi:uncharacterized protein